MSKKGKTKQMKSPQNAPPDALVDLPDSFVKKSMGITEPVFQFLEVRESPTSAMHTHFTDPTIRLPRSWAR
jgi:hypothetical protein